VTTFYLGRPWQNSPRTVYMNCYEPVTLASAGWTTMQATPGLYGEYNCYGPGFKTSRGSISGWPTANQARQLTYTEAASYSLANIFAKSSANSSLITYDWMPKYASPFDNMPIPLAVDKEIQNRSMPNRYELHQNYPNPFNPSTNISYDVPKPGMVSLKIYDIYGREIATLVEGMKPSGQYQKLFDASSFASGVYFARFQTTIFSKTIKLILIK
jgi:hypothetical protein